MRTQVFCINLLDADTPDALRASLARVLTEARPALVGPGDRLEPLQDRLLDAEDDRLRILLFAAIGTEGVGLIDACMHAPEPHALTIAQLAVCSEHRFRGVGRALVEAAIVEATRREDAPRTIHAAVRNQAHGALAFWGRLGLDEQERESGIRLLTRVFY